ncbi:DUF6185 family protein [Streptomyces inhibens]|uniref:DUF6185 family protein n=1 Tax=Streptomyces inhibens TaxID=2293571 RepID=UPI001EE712AD|nr:DUF6185 family protein [Streptomyces inhibens]UKY53634.1 DUF6185 family protein [Streptomyces inhibens]
MGLRCAAVLLVGLVFWGWWPARSDAMGTSSADDCHAAQLTAARTDVELRLTNHDRTVPEANGTMTVRVPTSWPFADDLLLSENSELYRRAMRCLLRERQSMKRPEEWRKDSPRVKAGASWVEVRYETLFQFHNGGNWNVGPWEMDVLKGDWALKLVPPQALRGAHWNRVEIDLGGLGASKVSPRPSTANNGHLVWTGLGKPAARDPMVTVEVSPPWRRAWAAGGRDDTEPLLVTNAAGVTTWWVGASIVIVLAALRARRQPASPQLTELEKSSSTALWRWGLIQAALGVLLLLLYKAIENIAEAVTDHPPTWVGYGYRWPVLIGILAGWLLVVSARPRKSVLLAASLVAAGAGLVAAVPSLFGLPPQLAKPAGLTDADFSVLVALAAAMQWLWLAGFALWAWMLAHEGGLLRPTAAPWRLRRFGPALAAVTVLLLGWAVWAIEHKWQRVSWLTDRSTPAYHVLHVAFLSQELTSFAYQVPTWYYAHAWVLTGLAIVALLRARDLAPTVPYASPTSLDRLLLAVFFAVVVAWRQNSYAGSQAIAVLWLVLDIAALYGLLAVGQRWSVLTQHLEGGEGSPQLSESITEAERSDLIARARRYRELTAALRSMEHGGGEGPLSRHAVEKELSRLHRWRPVTGGGGAPRPWLPVEITVVDVALSWGPHAKWWDNARRAAALAAAFGLPGSILMVKMDYSPPFAWMRRGLYIFGAPDVVWSFIRWELVWAGAGLVLGALWRLLPGRRGPARALGLVVAYALLIGLGLLGNLITDQEIGNIAVGGSLMLLILTLTSLAMDVYTFRSERRFWPNRVGQLLAIYQIRGFSAQVAYVLVQVIAVLTIFRFFASPDTRLK